MSVADAVHRLGTLPCITVKHALEFAGIFVDATSDDKVVVTFVYTLPWRIVCTVVRTLLIISVLVFAYILVAPILHNAGVTLPMAGKIVENAIVSVIALSDTTATLLRGDLPGAGHVLFAEGTVFGALAADVVACLTDPLPFPATNITRHWRLDDGDTTDLCSTAFRAFVVLIDSMERLNLALFDRLVALSTELAITEVHEPVLEDERAFESWWRKNAIFLISIET